MPISHLASTGFGVTFMPISDIFQELPTFRQEIERFHPLKSASLVAGLLTDPSFHANTLRIELLIHLLIAFAAGSRRPSTGDLNSWLNSALGSTSFARMEDPVEDVFISNLITKDGNIRIFEGTWESNDFYLQRVWNVVQTLPENQDTNTLKRQVRAVLLLGEEIAVRLHLERFCQGGGMDKETIRIPSAPRLKILCQAIAFSPDDLRRLNIASTELAPFTFQPSHRDKIQQQAFGDNQLIRRPIVQDEDNYFVLLPSAISIAVRQYILDWMLSHGYRDSFDEHLIMEYQDFFHETPIFGLPLPRRMPMPAKSIAGSSLLDVNTEVDKGRYLHLLAIVDGISGYANHGFSLPEHDPMEISNQIEMSIKGAQDYFRKLEGFKQGLTLLIGCGYGRPSSFFAPKESADWRVEFVSAPDFQSLAWLPGGSSLIIWKLIDRERFLADHQVSILNASGLLNLYGWWVDSGYLMLHPEIEFPGSPIHIAIATDYLADIRKKVRQGWDSHALPFPDGTFIRVLRKSADSYFPGESNKAQYAAIEAARAGCLLGAWKGNGYIWWLLVEKEKSELSHDLVYRIWDAIINWLELAVPVFESHCRGLTGDAVLVVIDLNNVHNEQENPVSEEVLRSSISISSDKPANSIRLIIRDPFFAGFRNPKNIAEHILLSAIAAGVIELAGEAVDTETLDSLIKGIVPDNDARYIHSFEAAHFREYIQHYDKPNKIFIDEADTALSKLGLGWDVRSRTDGDRLLRADESVKFLNKVVDALWKRMRIRLRNLNRVDFVKWTLWYIEGVETEKMRWHRTIRAVLALRNDKDSTKMAALKQIARCNASALALRLITEMAIPECPLNGGGNVGKLDLTPLMSDALMIFHLGGCSDAINKGVMEPEIKIAPCGDVLTHVGFRDEIISPLGIQFESDHLDYEAEYYEKHYERSELVATVKGKLNDTFLKAFESEFQFSFDTLRGVRESLEDFAVEKKSCVFIASQAEIMVACAKTGLVSPENVERVLSSFVLWPRLHWDNTPKGFDPVDWYPWRFGRQLSLVRRPLVCIEEGENPRYVISPGLFGQCMALTVSKYYEGEIDASKCRSISMKRWIDDETNRRGHAFEQKVYEKVKDIGYEARPGEKVTALVNDKLDQDYGDVDVLAWKPGDNIFLVIECKDLKEAKTPNEIAEQLNRFSGQILPNGERDNLLKHLDRCKVLKRRCRDVAKMIGCSDRDIDLRGVVCFSKPVAMQYVASRFPDISFVTIDNIKEILI